MKREGFCPSLSFSYTSSQPLCGLAIVHFLHFFWEFLAFFFPALRYAALVLDVESPARPVHFTKRLVAFAFEPFCGFASFGGHNGGEISVFHLCKFHLRSIDLPSYSTMCYISNLSIVMQYYDNQSVHNVHLS